MKNKTRRLLSAMAAVMIATTTAISASALGDRTYYLENEDAKNAKTVKTMHINKPYLSIDLDFGGLDPLYIEDLTYTIKKDGKVIGTFDNMRRGITIVDKEATCRDITGVLGDRGLNERLGSDVSATYKLSDLTGSEPVAVFPHGGFFSAKAEDLDTIELSANDEIYFSYLDMDSCEIVDRMTVPGNTFILSVSDAYANRGDTSTTVQLATSRDSWDDGQDNVNVTPRYKLCESAGLTTVKDLPVGKYMMWVGGGGNIFNNNVVITDEAKEYIKIRIPATAMSGINEDDLTKNGVYDRDKHIRYPLGNATVNEEGKALYVGYAFDCGGAIASADIPDKDGYLELWTLEEAPYLNYQTHYVPGGGGSTSGGVKVPFKYEKIVTEMEYPKIGDVALYDVEAGEYTVEIDSTEYELTGNKLTVTDSKEMQTMNLKLAKKQVSNTSSESPSSSEPSSSSSSSSSSEPSSQSSSSSSSASSSSSSSSNANPGSSQNPNTGAGSMIYVLAAAAGAAVIITRKKNK